MKPFFRMFYICFTLSHSDIPKMCSELGKTQDFLSSFKPALEKSPGDVMLCMELCKYIVCCVCVFTIYIKMF